MVRKLQRTTMGAGFRQMHWVLQRQCGGMQLVELLALPAHMPPRTTQGTYLPTDTDLEA